jgi:hypothetical protein
MVTIMDKRMTKSLEVLEMLMNTAMRSKMKPNVKSLGKR